MKSKVIRLLKILGLVLYHNTIFYFFPLLFPTLYMVGNYFHNSPSLPISVFDFLCLPSLVVVDIIVENVRNGAPAWVISYPSSLTDDVVLCETSRETTLKIYS